jgi:ubiquinone/menaquinone biosynthesis C-methylase UbiE
MDCGAEQDRLVREAFNSCRAYFEMMREWHRQRDGLAVEPEVKTIIAGQCLTGSRILEAGCGEGSISFLFAQRYTQAEFVGVDISQIGIDMAQQRPAGNLRVLASDLKDLPFEDDSFDFVFSQSVMEHVVGWGEAVREVR